MQHIALNLIPYSNTSLQLPYPSFTLPLVQPISEYPSDSLSQLLGVLLFNNRPFFKPHPYLGTSKMSLQPITLSCLSSSQGNYQLLTPRPTLQSLCIDCSYFLLLIQLLSTRLDLGIHVCCRWVSSPSKAMNGVLTAPRLLPIAARGQCLRAQTTHVKHWV